MKRLTRAHGLINCSAESQHAATDYEIFLNKYEWLIIRRFRIRKTKYSYYACAIDEHAFSLSEQSIKCKTRNNYKIRTILSPRSRVFEEKENVEITLTILMPNLEIELQVYTLQRIEDANNTNRKENKLALFITVA